MTLSKEHHRSDFSTSCPRLKDPSSAVLCTMLISGDNPAYTALSYTWSKDVFFPTEMFKSAKRVAKAYLQGDAFNIGDILGGGEPETSKTIVCNGISIAVQSNLYDALLQLRRRRPGTYWIDAVCINQR
ncbi:unnamed protein product [Periconia digitata]|uniref:Heterokaryon incompatibility domain-containing protein n=1 Tax=Periconia digitata TaxID=1303443 RepID=A0A9W4UQQ5_9PLEO|nr:unnamed protein product [Periconia digitata]